MPLPQPVLRVATSLPFSNSQSLNTLPPGSNDTQKVIDTNCTFVLFSFVYLESHPLYLEPRRIPILNSHREPKEPPPRPDNPPSLRPPITHLESILMKSRISVASKELTGSLSPLDSALTKNRGWEGVMFNQPRSELRNLTRRRPRLLSFILHKSPASDGEWPSTSVLRKIESFLYPEFYCSLDPTRIHPLFD